MIQHIYIRTTAYNAEKTLARTIESILNQTYTDFTYYLCDNGSTDGTGDIVRAYAAKDSRIMPFFNKINHDYTPSPKFKHLTDNLEENDIFCSLDADDEYLPTFLEQSILLAEKYNADIVTSGSYFLDAQSPEKVLSVRNTKKTFVLNDDKSFSDYFADYHLFMRTTWGKIYRGRSYKGIQSKATELISGKSLYGADTATCLLAVQNSKTVVVSDEILHKYYLSQKSSSYKWDSQRVDSDVFLHEHTIRFLSKYGSISEKNKDFLFTIYIYAVIDTLLVIFNADIDIEEKIEQCNRVMACSHTKEALIFANAHYLYNSRKTFVEIMLKFYTEVCEINTNKTEDICINGELLSSLKGDQDAWLKFQEIRLNYYIHTCNYVNAKISVESLLDIFPNDSKLLGLKSTLSKEG